MPSGGRKKPFSAKQKKEQLKAKREKKRDTERDEYGKPIRNRRKRNDSGGDSDSHSNSSAPTVDKLSHQPAAKSQAFDPNRYKLHFLRESDEDIQKRKEQARLPMENVPERDLEVALEDVYLPGSALDMPKRPAWDYSMSKAKLLQREEAYFKGYMETLMEHHGKDELSYFEVNLETWRQLWRVLEMADVVLLIADIRHPALHFSPALYEHVTKQLGKPLILVLNKIDLAPASLVVAWQHYFTQRFTGLHVVCFTSFPRESRDEQPDSKAGVMRRRKRNVAQAAGPRHLLQVLQSIVSDKVDLSSWREKLAAFEAGHEDELRDRAPEPEVIGVEEETSGTGDFHTHEAYRGGVLSIGCCGYPNVGKSSIINGLMGRKVVSVSKTPGHTKHFQTIFLTPTVKLCDSPGLVFPSLISKPMQVLAGIYPIAQVREPYTAVGYLARRLPLQELLGLSHPEDTRMAHERAEPSTHPWSAMDICEAWAEKRGFLTAKAARPDVYRAANHLLRIALDGRICLCTAPPGYTNHREFWKKHQDTKEIAALQELVKNNGGASEGGSGSSNRNYDDADVTSESDSDLDLEKDVKDTTSGESGDDVTAMATSSNPFSMLGVDD